MSDMIAALAGIPPGGAIDALRDLRPTARVEAQRSYAALFAPAEPGGMPMVERWAVALFVARLHGAASGAAHYAAGLQAADGSGAVIAAVEQAAREGATTGPYGAYPAGGPLVAENRDGPVLLVTAPGLDRRLAAALGHAHMLVFHPRDASPAHLQTLLDAGWTTDGIVTLSQLVAFLAFQLRVAHGLAVLAGATP